MTTSTSARYQAPYFLAAARSGHSADPSARCPHCGAPAGLHRGVDLASSPHFPMRAVICAQLDCDACRDALWLVVDGHLQACPWCNAGGMGVSRRSPPAAWALAALALPAARPPELTRCATCGGRRWVGDGYREPCGNCNAEALP